VGAGVHGDEFEGIAAALALATGINPATLRGRLLIAPVVNPSAVAVHSRLTPEDGANLNRAFPGDPKGTLTSALAFGIMQYLVRPADIVIDLHGAGLGYVIRPMVSFADAAGRDLASRYGETVLWEGAEVSQNLRLSAAREGKVSLGVECGGEARCDPRFVRRISTGVRRILRALGVLDGGCPQPVPQYTVIRFGRVTARAAGLFTRTANIDERVEAGASLGVVRDYGGDVVDEIRAAESGLVLGYRTLGAIQAGDTAFWIGRIVDDVGYTTDGGVRGEQ